MKRIYRVISSEQMAGDWNNAPAASIDVRPWQEGGALPSAEARVVFDGSAFHVHWKAWETNLRVVTHETHGPVWEDSCVEFFFNPAPQQGSRYLNFEINAEGVLLLGLGDNRDGRLQVDVDPAIFDIRADVPPHGAASWDKPYYTVQLRIPVSFLESIYGKLDLRPGAVLAGNFQKCGDQTANPHYGCWNPIEVVIPDFHRPEFFGDLVLD